MGRTSSSSSAGTIGSVRPVRFQPGFAVGDIHAARARVIEHRAEAITEIEGGPRSGGYWCYFRDPEGNVFELSQRLAPNPPRNR
ncbi:MAG TPA: VOC family protein [Actinomycetota bacterium]|nr:VOC family protein [Actinomycetota bacterium]